MRLPWKVDKITFFTIISEFDVVPFLQSRGWYESMNCSNVEFFVDSVTDPYVGFWGILTKHKMIGKKLNIESYCHKSEASSNRISKFFKEIIDTKEYDIVHFSDIEEVDASKQVAFRRSGFIRPIALKLCPMSIMVETNKDFMFHRNWRRQVTKSINAGNTFDVYTNPDNDILKTFVNLFNDFFLSLVRNTDGKPLCGRMTYLRNRHAYDVYAANSDESLATGAVYQNQQQLFEYLKSIGTLDFDYGRIPPGRDEMDNIYLAKSYSGGRPIVYNGEWEYNKSNIINWIYSMYRCCIHKAKRY
jgi:hypothetical protein